MGDLILFGFSVPVIIAGLLQLAKYVGMPDHWAQPLSIVLNLAAAIISQTIISIPETEPVLRTIVTTMVTFLTTVGLYHTAKNMGMKAGVVDKKNNS